MLKFAEVPNIHIHGTLTTVRPNPTNPKQPESVTMEAPGYETRIMLLLSRLRWTWVGWSLLAAIYRLGKFTMRIQPWTNLPVTDSKGVAPVPKNINATAGPTHFQSATPKGKPGLYCGSDPSQGIVAGAPVPGVTGTGSGSDTVVAFSPEMWTVDEGKHPLGVGPGITAKEILFHEMVHGYRQMSGKMQCTATPDQPGYDTAEEFMAILVSNMLRSELGLKGLRKDHWGFQAMAPGDEDPAKFAAIGNNKARIKQFCSEHPDLAANLKKAKIKFNPLLAA